MSRRETLSLEPDLLPVSGSLCRTSARYLWRIFAGSLHKISGWDLFWISFSDLVLFEICSARSLARKSLQSPAQDLDCLKTGGVFSAQAPCAKYTGRITLRLISPGQDASKDPLRVRRREILERKFVGPAQNFLRSAQGIFELLQGLFARSFKGSLGKIWRA